MSQNELLKATDPYGEQLVKKLRVTDQFILTPQYVVPVAAATVTAVKSTLILNPAGTLATLTIKFPPIVENGQRFTLVSTQIVTALTVTGATLVVAATALAVNTPLRYAAYDGKWYTV